MGTPMQRSIFGGEGPARAHGSKFAAAPAGYAAPPGSGPPGETCGTCANCRVRKIKKHNIYKCGLRADSWTQDRATDVLVRSPACQRWRAGKPQPTNAWGKPT